MRKRSSKKKSGKASKDRDENDLTAETGRYPTSETDVEIVLTPDGKNAAAVALGRLGGLKGGDARAAKLSAQERSDIARKAAAARWSRKGDQ